MKKGVTVQGSQLFNPPTLVYHSWALPNPWSPILFNTSFLLPRYVFGENKHVGSCSWETTWWLNGRRKSCISGVLNQIWGYKSAQLSERACSCSTTGWQSLNQWLLSAGLWAFLRAKPSLSCPGSTSPCLPQAVALMLLWPRPSLCKHQHPCYGGLPWTMVSTSATIIPSFPLFLLLDYSFCLRYRENTTWGGE